MKKFLTLALLAVLFVSCSDDDDKNSIVGTWTLQQPNVAKEVKTTNATVEELITKDIEAESDNTNILTFTADGKVKQYYNEAAYDEDDARQEGVYSLAGNKLTVTWDNDDDDNDDGVVFINLSKNSFSIDKDLTEFYQNEISYILQGAGILIEQDFTINKVISTTTYKRK